MTPRLDAASARFLDFVRSRLTTRDDGTVDPTIAGQLMRNSSLPNEFWGFAMVLYQPGQVPISVVRAAPGVAGVGQTIRQVARHPRRHLFALSDPDTCRVQCDFILAEPEAIDFELLDDQLLPRDEVPVPAPMFLDLEIAFSPKRLELGVHGLRIRSRNACHYFLPGDAFVYSILGMGQLRRHIIRLFPDEPIERLEFQRFHSISFVSTCDSWVHLYRGYPTQPAIRKAIPSRLSHRQAQQQETPVHFFVRPSARQLFDAAAAGVSWIASNQFDNGQFLYYYDGARDSRRDHEHPRRDPSVNPYYNLLRHCGAVITLLCFVDLQRKKSRVVDREIITAIEQGIRWFLQQLREYRSKDGQDAAYAFFNQKAKLGGSGLGLYVLSLYQHLFDDRYAGWADRIAAHLLNEIMDSGEFRYYYIYLNRPVSSHENRSRFSFYYPGEALIGLAGYARRFGLTSPNRAMLRSKLELALAFLIDQRPSLYRKHFTSLPSDSWLMMAINDLWNDPYFRQRKYAQFVFDDADQMVRQQYTQANSLFPDYVGSFYYHYGDHPYPDAARAEGLLAALCLATKIGDQDRVARYRDAVDRVAWATLRLCNTKDSVYGAPNPSCAEGGIRFKFTRQWFRIDTIQHVGSFFLKRLAAAD